METNLILVATYIVTIFYVACGYEIVLNGNHTTISRGKSILNMTG